MTDTEIKNCDSEDKQKELEELKSKVSNYISEHKDSLDSNIVSILTKFINEEELSSEEMVYLLLHIFMGQRGFESLQNYIQNKIQPDISLPMQQCTLPDKPSEAEKFQSIQQLVNVKIDSPEYIEQMKQLLDECKNTTPFITNQTKHDINNKFCMVQGFEKEQESDIQKANDPKFTLKVIAMMIIVLFLSSFVIGFCAMFM